MTNVTALRHANRMRLRVVGAVSEGDEAQPVFGQNGVWLGVRQPQERGRAVATGERRAHLDRHPLQPLRALSYTLAWVHQAKEGRVLRWEAWR